MIEKELTVLNRLGLHARSAAMVVRAASGFKSAISVRRGEVGVDGKSLMGLMLLAAEQGARLTVRAEGPDEKEAMARIENLFEARFDED